MKAGPTSFLDNQSTASVSDIELLTIDEAAELLTISVPTVRRLQQQRSLPFIKIGGSVRFAKSDLVSYVVKQRVGAVEQ